MRPYSTDGNHGMCTRGRHRFQTCMLLLALLLLRQSSGAQPVVPQTLFELRYGSADWEIGVNIGGEGPPIGPAGLAVGPSGDVYIADRVQRKVKRFDRVGNLLMATDGEVVNMGLPAIGPNDEILVGGGAGANELTMFNPDGSRVMSPTDEDLRIIEPRGGDYILAQIGGWMASHGLHPRVWLWSLHFDATGRLFVGVSGYDFEPGILEARGRVFVFSPDLQLTAVMLGDFVDPEGRVYSASSPWVRRISRRFEVRGPDGSLRREVDIPSLPTTADILPWMGGEDAGVWYALADRMGNVYLVDAVPRTSVGEPPLFLTEQLQVGGDLSVVKLGPEGNLAAAFRIPGGPFVRVLSVDVDSQGDIYYFDFGPESVRMNVIYAESLVAAASKVPSKIVAVRGPLPPEQRTVALRRGLDGQGWQFTWHGKTRRAVAVSPEVRVEVTVGSDRAKVNGKLVPLSKPAVLSSGRTYVPCSFVAEIARLRHDAPQPR